MDLNSLTFGLGGMDSPIKILISHTLGQDPLFAATPVVNNFESLKISSNSLTFSQGGTDLWALAHNTDAEKSNLCHLGEQQRS